MRVAALLFLTVLTSYAHVCIRAQAQAYTAPLLGGPSTPSSLQGGEERSTSELLVAFGNDRSRFVSPFLPSP